MRAVSPSPGWFEAQSDLRRTTLLAAVAWVLVHLVDAVASADAVERPWTYALGVGLWLLGCALALRPLWWPAPTAQDETEALVVAVLVPVVSVLDVASLRADQVATYANWVDGGSAVLLVALVLRRHGLLALAAGAALLVVEGLGALAARPLPLAGLAGLLVPVPLWLVGSWAVRRHVRRAGLLAAELRARRAAVATDRVLAQRWGQLRSRHRADLEEQVLPMLRRVRALAPGEELSDAERDQAREAAGHMRDALLARSLMTRGLRRHVRDARARGVRVMLHNSLDDGPAVHALRDLVGVLLDVPGLQLLSVRTFVDPGQATLVLRGDESFALAGLAAVTEAAGERGLEWWERTEVHDLDGDVMVQLTGPRVD